MAGSVHNAGGCRASARPALCRSIIKVIVVFGFIGNIHFFPVDRNIINVIALISICPRHFHIQNDIRDILRNGITARQLCPFALLGVDILDVLVLVFSAAVGVKQLQCHVLIVVSVCEHCISGKGIGLSRYGNAGQGAARCTPACGAVKDIQRTVPIVCIIGRNGNGRANAFPCSIAVFKRAVHQLFRCSLYRNGNHRTGNCQSCRCCECSHAMLFHL